MELPPLITMNGQDQARKERVMNKLIISAFGQDQPGIVSTFTQVLYDLQANIEDTSMTQLEDHFTMLVMVTVPKPIAESDIADKLNEAMGKFNMQFSVHNIETMAEVTAFKGRPWLVSVSGQDNAGIVYHVCQYLAKIQANVRHLSTKRLSRPGGETLFLMAVEVDVPDEVTQESVEADLAVLSEQHQLEIHAEPLEVYTL